MSTLHTDPSRWQRWAAELLGTLGWPGLTGAYAFGPVSGGHFNPAITIGLAAATKFEWRDVVGYVISQVVGASVAATLLFVIASNQAGFDATRSGFASNGFGDRSPGGYGLVAVLLTELVLTGVFLFVILGVSDKRAAVGLNGVSIGLVFLLAPIVGALLAGFVHIRVFEGWGPSGDTEQVGA